MSSLPSSLETRLDRASREHLLLAGIVVVALVVRAYALGAESLWVDEVYTARVVLDRGLANILFVLPVVDVHPPFYYAVLWAWTRVTGVSAVSIRALSLVASVVSLPFVYAIARRLYDRRVGLLSALLFAVSPFYVYYAREARMYAVMTLVALWSMYAMLGWMDGESEWWRSKRGYAVATVALVYTHAFGILIVVAQNAYVMAFQDPGDVDDPWFGDWGRTQVGVGVVSAPYFLNLLGGVFGDGRLAARVEWIPPVTPVRFWEILGSHVGRTVPPSSPFDRESLWVVAGQDLSVVGELVTFVALALLVFLAVRHVRSGDAADGDAESGGEAETGEADAADGTDAAAVADGQEAADGTGTDGPEAADGGVELAGVDQAQLAPGALLACWLIVPVVAMYAASVLVTPLLFDRFTAPAGVAVLILLARAVSLLADTDRQTVAAAGMVVLVLGVPLAGLHVEPHKHEWDRAVEVIESDAESGDHVLVTPFWANETYHYYSTRDDLSYGTLPAGAAGWQVTATVSEADAVWLVVTHQNASQRTAVRQSMGYAGLERTRHVEVEHIDVYRYERTD